MQVQEDDDEVFNKYIEYDDSGSDWDDLEKENVNTSKQPKSTQEQMKTIYTFTNDYSEDTVGKDLYNVLWDYVTTELNNIGPPSHPTKKWKRIWTVSKYNKKIRSGNATDTKSSSCRDQPSPNRVPKRDQSSQPPNRVPKKKARVLGASADIDVDSRSAMLEKLSTVLSNQNVIEQKADESRSLLEEIAQGLLQ